MGLRMIEKRPRVAEATKYKPSADSASSAAVDTTWSSLGKYVETTACRTYTKPPNVKHPNAPKMEMKRTRKRFASAGVCVCMAMIESDNVRDHRAGTSDSPFQNTRKSGFVCMYAQHGRVVVGCVGVCRKAKHQSVPCT